MPSPSPDATPPLRAERWLVFGGPRALRETLEAMPNEVRRVKDSAAFVASLHGDHPDVAVLTMPPGTSDDLAALIAARHRRPGLTACLLTSASMVDERLQALASGIDEALPAGVTDSGPQPRLRPGAPATPSPSVLPSPSAGRGPTNPAPATSSPGARP